MDLENFLKIHGMKQSDLAKALGTSAQNVSKWVSGEGVPSFEFCKKLLELGVSVEDLFGITDVKAPSSVPALTSSEFIDILKEALISSLDSVKMRIEIKNRPDNRPDNR